MAFKKNDLKNIFSHNVSFSEAIISISPLLIQYIPDLIPTEVVSIIIVAPNLSLKESLQYTCSSDPL